MNEDIEDDEEDFLDDEDIIATENYGTDVIEAIEDVQYGIDAFSREISYLRDIVENITIPSDIKPDRQRAAKFTCFLCGLFLGVAGCFAGAVYYLYINPRTVVNEKVVEVEKNLNVILMQQKPPAQAPVPPQDNSKEPAPIQPEK